MEVLDLRAHVWGVEQDLGRVVKHGKSTLLVTNGLVDAEQTLSISDHHE